MENPKGALMINRFALAFVVVCLILPAAHSNDAPPLPTKRALLIGIDNYENHPALGGAVSDVELLASALAGRFDFKSQNIRKLINEQATRAAIMQAFDDLKQASSAGDVIVVHFSGYGSQEPGDDGELDGLDETIVPFDGKLSGGGEITDDQLNEKMSAIAARTPNATLILDVCFGGQRGRNGATMRCLESGAPTRGARSLKAYTGVERFQIRPHPLYTLSDRCRSESKDPGLG